MATRTSVWTAARQHRSWCAIGIACVLLLGRASSASASDQIYFSAVDNVTNVLVQHINAETVRLDISTWYLTEHAVSMAIANRFAAGVPVRLMGDRAAMFEIDASTKREFFWLASLGVPIRLRFNPTWYPEIDHWKMAIFVGQNMVEFGSANYATFELAPWSSTNYDDETAMFTDDPVLVKAFKTKFDRTWNDTTLEPQSQAGAPPYYKNWYDACANEPTGNCDFFSQYPNPAPMNISTARLEPDNPMPADLIWGQGPDFNNRLITEINKESSRIQFVIYRLTVDDITLALLSRWQAGVQMQLIVEPKEYFNRAWPEFWLTHANIDKLWAAGVPIKQRAHDGVTHMKTLVTSAYATNASSNYAAAWQRDHDYFVSASGKPSIYSALKNRLTTMWNDATAFTWFQPQPPDAATLEAPGNGATAVSTTPTLVWDRATFAVSYDVYLGTSSSAMTLVANVPAQLNNNPPTTYSWTPSAPLQSGTTYLWKVVSRTNATAVNASISATSLTWPFTTAGGAPPPPPPPPGGSLPSPWTSQDIGAVGLTGTASYSSGTFTVQGAGSDIWGAADSFRYAYQSLGGDGQIVARVVGERNTNGFAKAGVMLRATTSAGSAHVVLDAKPDGSIEFMTRSTSGGPTSYIAGASQAFPSWLRLVRSGSTVTGSVSANGSTWTTVGTTTISMSSSALIGLAVTSHDTSMLNTGTFDNVVVSTGGGSPPPPSASNVVIYASDIPSSARHGSWTMASDSTAAAGIKLVTSDLGVANTNNALASPTDYVDVTFNATAGTPYRIWVRLRAVNNSKYNDSLWVQFSDAIANGSAAYPIGTTSGLMVNLATDSTASSLSGWGWQNTAYWLSQPTVVTFPTTGSHSLRVQVREDGVQFDQIVLSPDSYYNSPPGPVSNDSTIVPKP